MATTTDKTWFHVWSDDGCVAETPSVGGVTFPRRTRVSIGESGGKTDWSTRQGDYLPLTEEQLARIREGIARRVQRVYHKVDGRPVGKIYLLGSDVYRPEPGDEPLGKYLHLRAVSGPPEASALDADSSLLRQFSAEEEDILAGQEAQAHLRKAAASKKARAAGAE